MEADKQYPNLLPASALESLRRHVEIDKEQLAQQTQAPMATFMTIYVRMPSNAVAMAEADLIRTQDAFAKMPEKSTKLRCGTIESGS